MGVAYIQGLQGDNPHYLKVAATMKHFAVNNVETNRQRLSAEVDERNLMEYWLPHWKAAIMEGHAQSVMASYNAINGAPDAINKYLLTDILRGQWKFDGFVTDDLGGVNLLVAAHHITEDPVVATAEAIKAGCDSDDVLWTLAKQSTSRSPCLRLNSRTTMSPPTSSSLLRGCST